MRIQTDRPVSDVLVVSAAALEAAHLTPDEARLELALALYAQDRLTLGQAADLAARSQEAFLETMGQRGIEVHYGVEAFEEDLVTLRRLGRL